MEISKIGIEKFDGSDFNFCELKKSIGTTKQVGVEVELQNNSQNDVIADTQETLETIAEEPDVKQVGVEVELLKDSSSDVVADTQETPETIAE